MCQRSEREHEYRDRPEFRFGRRELAVEIYNLRADKSRLTLQVIQLRERLELVKLLATVPQAAAPQPAEPATTEPPEKPAESTP